MDVEAPAEIEILDYHPTHADLKSEILAGLKAPKKGMPPKYFYDRRGAHLFDEICEQPEYYPTLTELGIMQANMDEIAALVGPTASLIEFGSGSGLKTRILLEHLVDLAAYVPVDISKDQLLAVGTELSRNFPHIDIRPVCADFTQPFGLPHPKIMPLKNVVFFPGSTIGNFYPDKALSLLRAMSRIACEGGALLLGVDLKKDPKILDRAYNDAAGVTAAFNLNMLARANRELGADFDLDGFRHHAFYNEQMGRVEMHLVSKRDQTVTVAGERIDFREGESIHTENSHKYSLEEFAAMAAKAGFEVTNVWTDAERLFSVQYLACRHPSDAGEQ